MDASHTNKPTNVTKTVAMIQDLFTQIKDTEQASELMQRLMSQMTGDIPSRSDLCAVQTLSSAEKADRSVKKSNVKRKSGNVEVRNVTKRKATKATKVNNEYMKQDQTKQGSVGGKKCGRWQLSDSLKPEVKPSEPVKIGSGGMEGESTKIKTTDDSTDLLRRSSRSSRTPKKLLSNDDSDDNMEDFGNDTDDPDYNDSVRKRKKVASEHKIIDIGSLMSCIKCRASFVNYSDFSSHICEKNATNSETNDTRLFPCSSCNLEFNTAETLRVHNNHCRRTETDRPNTNRGESMLTCRHCGKCFTRRAFLTTHLKFHQPDGAFICTICGEICATSESYEQHKSTHTDSASNSIVTVCKLCGTQFFAVYRYKKHMANHEKFRCEECQGDFTSYNQLNQHTLQVHSHKAEQKKRFFCDECGEGYMQVYQLDDHRRIHTGEKPIRCEVCVMFFRTKRGLRKHVLTDGHLIKCGLPTKEKKYLCPLCGGAYRRKQTLDRHMKWHSEDRPYKCTHCDYTSPDEGNLKRHIRLHFNSGKSFICDVCGMSFHAKKTLESHHLYKHEDVKAFSCTLCSRSFKIKNALKRHIINVHERVKGHKCHCGSAFKRQCHLRRHMLAVHGNDDSMPPLRNVTVMDAPPKTPKVKQKLKGDKTKSMMTSNVDPSQSTDRLTDDRLAHDANTPNSNRNAVVSTMEAEQQVRVEVSSMIERFEPSILTTVVRQQETIEQTQRKEIVEVQPDLTNLRTPVIDRRMINDLNQSLDSGSRLPRGLSLDQHILGNDVPFRVNKPSIIQPTNLVELQQLPERRSNGIVDQSQLSRVPIASSAVQIPIHDIQIDRSSLSRIPVEHNITISREPVLPMAFHGIPVNQSALSRIPVEHLVSKTPYARQHNEQLPRYEVNQLELSRLDQEILSGQSIELSTAAILEELGRSRADTFIQHNSEIRRLSSPEISPIHEHQRAIRQLIEQPVVIIDNAQFRGNPNAQVVATKILPHIDSATLDPLHIHHTTSHIQHGQMPQMPIVMSTHINESAASSYQPQYNDVYVDPQLPVVILPAISSYANTEFISQNVANHYVKHDSQLALDALNYRINPNYIPISGHHGGNISQ